MVVGDRLGRDRERGSVWLEARGGGSCLRHRGGGEGGGAVGGGNWGERGSCGRPVEALQ